jgi:hypothetical protein
MRWLPVVVLPTSSAAMRRARAMLVLPPACIDSI